MLKVSKKIIDLFKKIKAEEDKMKILREFTFKTRYYLDIWVVARKEFPNYWLIYYIGLIDDTELFFREDPILGALDIGTFYKKIGVKDDVVPYVQQVKGFGDDEIGKIVEVLEKAILRKGVQRMVVPSDFFVFQFQVLWSKERPKKGAEGRARTLIFMAEFLNKAISQLKKALQEMTQNYFKNFMVFYDDRWRILKTKTNNRGWLPKDDILKLLD